MSLLKNLTSDASIANEKDSLGSGGIFESGLHLFTVSTAHIIKSGTGALGLVLSLKNDDGRELRNTQWMTSGTAKGGTNFYTDKDGAKQYLPGYLLANSLALLAIGKEIGELDTEPKVINAYSYDAKADVPTKVEMVMDLLGKQIYAGVLKQTVDKTAKGDDGKYLPTGETREQNEIDKFFRASDKMTTAEIRGKAESATFAEQWATKWTGKTQNKAKGAGANAGTAGAPKAAGTAKPKTSLFAA